MKYESPDVRVEAYKDIKVELEIKKVLGILTETEMIKIKDEVKKNKNDIKVSNELDSNIPRMIEEVKTEMKNKKEDDEFLSSTSLSNYIDKLRDEKAKVKVLENRDKNAA